MTESVTTPATVSGGGQAGPPRENKESPSYYNTGAVQDVVEGKTETAELEYVGEPKTIDQDFVFVTHLDPARQADPQGVYLDDVQRREAEVHRARQEGRKPDLKNPPATVGTPVVPIHVAKVSRPADAVIEADFSLPVEVGVNPDDLNSNQAAKDAQTSDEQSDKDE